MRKVIVDLKISFDDFQALYRGTARTVFAYDIHGRSVRFPANILKRFLTHQGIYGRFMICFDQDNKFSKINKLA